MHLTALDKGKIESLIKYVKRNFLAIRDFKSVVVKEKVPKMGKKMTHPILGQNGRWIS